MGRLDVDAMLAEMTRREFDEWILSDELDGTVSGIDRLTWTVANGAMAICAGNKFPVEAAALIPGQHDAGASSGQSIEEQKAACYAIAARQNASLR
jgi:hypothetical protein